MVTTYKYQCKLFSRILQDGSSARPRGYGKSSGNEHDESSTQLNEF